MSKTRNERGANQCSQEQIDLVQKIVRETFREMKNIEDALNSLQQIRSALKRDLIDIKDGRLDRISHRQEIDKVSKENSIFIIEEKVEIGAKNPSQWYVPYEIKFRKDALATEVPINNSIAKIHAGGACKLDDGEVKYL